MTSPPLQHKLQRTSSRTFEPAVPLNFPNVEPDEAIQDTNNDACISKSSAVKKGYYKDPWVTLFQGPGKSQDPSPLINRGYHSRLFFIHLLLYKFFKATQLRKSLLAQAALNNPKTTTESDTPEDFDLGPLMIDHPPTIWPPNQTKGQIFSSPELSSPKPVPPRETHPYPCQVVLLGAGFDTTYFNLKARGHLPLLFVEVEFSQVLQEKRKIIKKNAVQKETFGQWPHFKAFPRTLNDDGIAVLEPGYVHMEFDLKSDPKIFIETLKKCGVSTKIPTFFLSECVFIYLDPTHTNSILNHISSSFDCPMVVTYEQIRPYDHFGQRMIQNLWSRGCPLLSLTSYPDIATQRLRYLHAGFGNPVESDPKNLPPPPVIDSSPRSPRLVMLPGTYALETGTVSGTGTNSVSDSSTTDSSSSANSNSGPCHATDTITSSSTPSLFSMVRCDDMYSLYNTVYSNKQRHEIEAIEQLDEFEEWELIMKHYCIISAIKDTHLLPNHTKLNKHQIKSLLHIWSKVTLY